ncbi:protein obstructor-E-like [Anabrus simplex]|uniref:protein obstructor-E-like n=1 Tax=Anabrus simplex TaxID=316456 RepID=UPI0035A37088
MAELWHTGEYGERQEDQDIDNSVEGIDLIDTAELNTVLKPFKNRKSTRLKFNTSDGLSEDAPGIGKNGTHNIIQKRSVQDKDFQEMLPGYSSDFEPDEAANSLEENDDQPFNCSSNYGYFPDPKGNCSVYYSCRDGLPEKRVCTNGTLHFNPVSGVCDYPEFALCKRECPGRNGAFPVLGFCHKYLDCIDGQGRYVDCPPDQHFNAITKLCDNPSRAACEVTCPSYDTLMPLPGRCEMYASCKEGKPTYHLCPRGLHFNPIHLYCDYPGQSGCHIQTNSDGSINFRFKR